MNEKVGQLLHDNEELILTLRVTTQDSKGNISKVYCTEHTQIFNRRWVAENLAW